MKKTKTILFIPIIIIIVLYACYPLSIGSLKWKIKWDKDMIKGKKAFLEKQTVPNAQKPNIVLIIADDLGKYEVSAYDGVTHINTPNIDAIGKEGVVFEEAYVTSPTCAPSRAGIMTGRVQNRYGYETQIMEYYPSNFIEYLTGKFLTNTGDFVVRTKPVYPREWEILKQGVPPSEINLAEILKKNGYATGVTGKWHLGESQKHIPLKRGFDYQYGFYGAFSWYTPQEITNGVVNYYHNNYSSKYQWRSGRNEGGAIREQGKIIKENDYLTFAIKDKAVNFIENNKDKPFFLYCSFSAPHEPFQAPINYYAKYLHIEDENKRVYYAMISALDDAVGEILKKIKDEGLENNTIIYFISDNGGATYTEATTNGPLKGGKLTEFEGGLNVPFLMKWKNHIPEGLRYPYPVSSTDIFTTTILNIGEKLPSDREYDGVNLLPYLNNQIDSQPHQLLFWRADHIWALRDGDYKMILSTKDGWAELYNLKTDKSEKYNLREQMPELFLILYNKHKEWQNNKLPKKPMWPRIMDHRFIIDGKEYLFPA